MTFIAKIHNGTIAVPPGIDLPEGTEVEVLARDVAPSLDAGPLSWMRRYAGAAKGLPEDFASEHDHYIHGTQKREA